MTGSPQQVSTFICASAPFDALSEHDIAPVLNSAEVLYLTQENSQALLQAHHGWLFLIQTGEYTVQDSERPQRHVSEGDFFGYHSVLDDVDYALSLTVDTPGLVYCIPQVVLKKILEIPVVKGFFTGVKEEVLQNQAVIDSNSMWLYKPLSELASGHPIMAGETISIQDAAMIMSENKVSSLLITRDDKLVGIVTDRDLRNRVVAKGMNLSLPISAVMTEKPAMIVQNRTMFDAMSLMSERNIHHLPIIDRASREPVGIVTATDVIKQQKSNVLFIISELSKAESLYALTNLSWQLPHYLASHAKRLGDFDIAGKVLSQATDIMTRKLIGFYQQQHGKAPMAFSWLVYGSQAREDQTMGSDQDNGLLLARQPNESEAEYFKAMSEYVCDGLNKCGIKLCDGNIMASNPALRMSLDDAITEAKAWVKQPTNEAILAFNIYLDTRVAAGDVDLFRKMQQARAPLFQQKMFLAALARQSNDVAVPLSMFQKFVFEKGHSKKDCIDIKVRAVALINNLVRLYALANGLTMPSTLGRLASLPAGSGLSSRDAENLRDIWLFLNRLRWRHQLTNSVTDNKVSISDLSSIEKHQLKAAFKAIGRSQQAAVMHFSGGIA